MKDEILAAPIEYRDFSLVRPQGPGLGVVPDLEKIARYDRDAGRVLRSVAGE
jgi:muconate cycloisomerase